MSETPGRYVYHRDTYDKKEKERIVVTNETIANKNSGQGRAEKHKALLKVRKLNGMTTRGFVSKKFNVLTMNPIKESNPLFHGFPHMCVRKYDENLFLKLKNVESRIESIIGKKHVTAHKYGANEGVNCGISIVSGGGYAR
jgi:hypothetical protein